MERMCAVTKVNRAGFYRFRQADQPPDADEQELSEQIRKIARKWPAYGTRRVTVELQQGGWEVNRKRVQRLMRAENLLCRRKRKFEVTTDSNHQLEVYQNLAPEMELTGVNQLWVADITYIRLAEEFVYLAVVLDAFSRRVIGWKLDRTLKAELALGALRMALARRQPPEGLVHHSDRGIQYACGDYIDELHRHGLVISMSRKASPWDNATCESFMKTLKSEEVDRAEYRDLPDARRRIGRFLEQLYNQQRLHSALGYRSPAQFEQSPLTAAAPKPAREATR